MLCFAAAGVASALRTPTRGTPAPHPTRRAFFGSAAALVCVPGAALAIPDERATEEPTDAATAAVGSAVAAKGWAPTAAGTTAAGTTAAGTTARAEEPTEPRKYENWLDGYAYKPGTPISAYLKQTYGLRTSEEILAPTLQRYADEKASAAKASADAGSAAAGSSAALPPWAAGVAVVAFAAASVAFGAPPPPLPPPPPPSPSSPPPPAAAAPSADSSPESDAGGPEAGSSGPTAPQ